MGQDSSGGFVDVPSNTIDHFEKDATPAPEPPPAPMPVAVIKPGAPLKIDQVVETASGRHQLDPDLISSVIHAESGFNPRAVSTI